MSKQTVGRTVCLLFILILLKSETIEATHENLEDVQTINDAISSEDKSIADINSQESEGEEIIFVDVNREQQDRRLFKSEEEGEPLGMDSLTIIWYLTTFTALLGFFIVMACTEKSCNRGRVVKPVETRTSPPTPCPSYKNFAPPSYDTVMQKYQNQRIFIVPVHDSNSISADNEMQNHVSTVRIDIDKEITT